MVKLTLSLDKSVEENAGEYFESSKKQKKKISKILEIVAASKKKLEKLEKEKTAFLKAAEIEEKEKQRKVEAEKSKEWYEKFRWFISSEGFLVIGGRDSTTNEIIIKKHADKDDLVFHTDMAGSPFFVVKAERKKIGEQTLKETANATASYSRAWKLGIAMTDVFYVKPDQVTKEANTGEYVQKGAFIIRGKTNYISSELKVAIGLKDGKIIGGPVAAIKPNSEKLVIITQGNDKPSDAAKKVRHKLGGGDLDEIIRFLPSGGCRVD